MMKTVETVGTRSWDVEHPSLVWVLIRAQATEAVGNLNDANVLFSWLAL